MSWIVIGEESGKIKLISSKKDSDSDGILYAGSYLTIEEGKKKFILRVENSGQEFPYSPSPMIVDMDLSSLSQDQKCQNLIHTTRIIEAPERENGMGSFIKPQMKARRSNQDEIDLAFENKEGIPVFPATVFGRNSQVLRDNVGKIIQVKIPEDVFFHQMLITGATGSGKTVAMKYMAQYFLENLEMENGPGAVLAVNVKEEDMLTLDKASKTRNPETLKEWSNLSLEPHGVDTFRVYYPGNRYPNYSEHVDAKKCEKITLMTEHLDPESLAGLIQNISDIGADQLPAIFRYWKQRVMKKGETLNDFIQYFADPNKERSYMALNTRDEELPIKMHYGTFQNVLNALTYATEYFDVERAKELDAEDILQPGKMSVIDVTEKYGFGFGSVLLRDLLDKIYDAKSQKKNNVPILIIIDEVHEFYGSERSREALQTLDAICRKGRSLQIGVIFASQTPQDMPRGISNVVNTKVCFKSDPSGIRLLGITVSGFDPESLRAGYAIASVHGLSQLRFVKFPMSLAGVYDT